jgi:membrane protein YqaA with SNARE-associated domain
MPASAPSGRSPDRVSRRDRAVRLGLRLAAVAAILALALWANLYAADHDLVREATRRYGYAGILAAAAVSGFNLVVPVPIIAFFPFFMEAGLAPVPTVLVIAAGMTAGDLVGYLVGRTARDVVRPTEGGVVRRLEALRDRHPRLPLLVMFLYAAFAPAPNEIVVIPLAFLRYPVAGIFAAVLAGNLIFNALVAAGVIHIFGLL